MHWMDIIAIIIFAWFLVKGYFNGLIMGSFRLIGLILGVILGSNYSVSLGNALFGRFDWNPTLVMALGFVIIFLLVIIAAQLLANLIRSLMHVVLLGWVDKLGGVALGALKAIILLCVIFWIFDVMPQNTWVPKVKQNSQTYQMLQGTIPVVYKSLIKPFFDEEKLRDQLKTHVQEDILPNIQGTTEEFSKFLRQMGTFDFQEQQYLEENFKKLSPAERKEIMVKLKKGGQDMREALERLNIGI
ncbi:MAG: CvpA family protein [Candidatus Marinimicrobia bacterium]|nr:CvpA family protein [Candidatus Neomarinimicrobiota bacterium]MDD5582496.1 CvpA family protein [Candidatus Neomarinimicrobiota bacterium]